MKFLLTVLFFAMMCCPVYGQGDTVEPDIYLPSVVITALPGGNGDGPVTTPPPLGYWWGPSTPEGGTDYWKFTGKLADGTSYEIWMQQYMAPGLHVEDKCNKAKDAVNYASDYHTSGKDPISATVSETGRVEVKPNAGCTITSSELENGSKQTDDSTGEIADTPDPGESVSYRAFTASFTGVPSGKNLSDEYSYASIGVGYIKISTFIYPGESHRSILTRFKAALSAIGVVAKFGQDQYGDWHLVCQNPYASVPFGTDDTGMNDRVILTRIDHPLTNGASYQFGRFCIKLVAVDPDEAMPMW